MLTGLIAVSLFAPMAAQKAAAADAHAAHHETKAAKAAEKLVPVSQVVSVICFVPASSGKAAQEARQWNIPMTAAGKAAKPCPRNAETYYGFDVVPSVPGLGKAAEPPP